jgi:cell volume regulation protein A
MSDVALFLLAISGIFLLGALGEIVFQRTNIPDVIWLILVGILLGPLTGALSREMLNRIAPFFAAITLVVVLFEGGSALRLRDLSRSAARSTVLAVVAFGAAVAAVSVMSMGARFAGVLPAEWTWTHGLMLGAILGGSSSIIIMPAMAQARIDPKIANLVSLESALTDAFCVVGTTALIDLMLNGGEAAQGAGWALGRSFGIGLIVGLISGTIWLLVLRFLHSNEHAYPVTLAALLALYVLVEHLGGSAAFGILTFAVVLGNAKMLSSKLGMVGPVELDSSVRGFHRQMAFIVKSFFFVFIGAMLGPPWISIGFGILLGAVLFAVRIPSVNLALAGSGLSRAERTIVQVALPRGMAAGVLATLPASAGVPGTETLPVAVFACVFTTILAFAVGFPLARRGVSAVVSQASSPPLPAGAARPEIAGSVTSGEVVPGGGAAAAGGGTDKPKPG